MPSYFGVATKKNKIAWGVVATLMGSGIVLALAGVIGGYSGDQCLRLFRDCSNSRNALGKPNSVEMCRDLLRDICDLDTWVSLIIAGAVIWLVGAVSCSFFCCCSAPPPPRYIMTVQQTGVGMQPMHAGPNGQQYYAPPPHGQPPHGYPPMQPGMPMVVTAQPVMGYPANPQAPGNYYPNMPPGNSAGAYPGQNVTGGAGYRTGDGGPSGSTPAVAPGDGGWGGKTG